MPISISSTDSNKFTGNNTKIKEFERKGFSTVIRFFLNDDTKENAIKK